ncbi:MAG: 16S rRNA (cytosine(967)-C(5))-methyltransferase RsmB, partial [Pyrinomonadaceae bacterium]
MKSKSVSPARLAAFEILRRVEEGAFASTLLATQPSSLVPMDRALSHELVLGVLRHQLFLDSLLEHFASRKVSNLDVAVRISLRLGLYQLRFLSRVPASAAVNESVNLIRLARLRSAEGFVNAVLRRATREPDYDPIADISDPAERLAIETSHPRWLIDRWITAFGFGFTADMARANNQAPPLAFRIVKNKASEKEVIQHLHNAGATASRSKIAARAWLLEGPAGLLLELARAGKVYLQDEGSQLVAEVLGGEARERVLDLCAAPGSKTSQIADLADNRATVVATDWHESRLRTVVQTANLHGLSSIRPLLVDGLKPLPFAEGSFDAVLVDAPCSGTGTLRRNPEIRWRISSADLLDLSARQKQLLSNAGAVVKRGGRLVYSTCSVEPEENEEIVEAFLAADKDFERVDLSLNPVLLTDSKAVRTWPHRDGVDGFFIAALR